MTYSDHIAQFRNGRPAVRVPDTGPDWSKNTLGLCYLYIIDPVEVQRRALHTLLSRRSNAVVRAYRDTQDFLSNRDTLEAGCVIIVSATDGADAHDVLTLLRPDARFVCIVLATQLNIRSGINAIKAGASEYLLYSCAHEELAVALDDALGLVRQRSGQAAAVENAQARIARLSTREKEVLYGLMQGKSNKMIALQLDISPRTIEIYRAHLMEKLEVHSLSEVLRIAFIAGLSGLPQLFPVFPI